MNKKILFVNACVRKNSRTYRLSKKLLFRLEEKYSADGGCEIQEVNLEKENILPLNAERLEKREELLQQNKYDDEFFKYARDFAAADIVVVAAPYWDFSFPALLKIYFERVMVLGITFSYTSDGKPVPLCKAKSLFYVSTAGGPVFHGFLSGNPHDNSGFDYVKELSEVFFGIKDFKLFQAENLDIVGADVESILAKTEKEIRDWELF